MISGTALQKYPPDIPDFSKQMLECDKILKYYNCSSIKCARQNLTAEQLLFSTWVAPDISSDFAWWPVVDGAVVPKQPLDAMEAGEFARPLDIATLTMQDEGTLFTDWQLTPTTYEDKIRGFFDPRGDEVLALYPPSDYPEPSGGLAWAAMFRDYFFVCPSRTMMEQVRRHRQNESRVYQAVFMHPDSWSIFPTAGVMHSSANPFVFGSSFFDFTPAEAELSIGFRRFLTSFAATGDPGIPQWAEWDPVEQRHLVVDLGLSTGSRYRSSQCDFFAALNSTPSPGPSCPPQPAEQCCTRVLKNPAAMLRISLPVEVRLASLTLWAQATDSALLRSEAQLEGAFVQVGDGSGVMTGCSLGTPGAVLPARPGFSARELVCGARGSVIALAFPNILRSAPSPPPAVALRICATASEGWGPAVLWVQAGP
jgi:hypothetical protein